MAGGTDGPLRHVHGCLPFALHGRNRKVRPASSLRLAARCDGRSHTCQRVNSRGDDGDGGCLCGRALARFILAFVYRNAGGRHGGLRDSVFRRDDRPRANGHQESFGLFHRQPTRLHVSRLRRRRIHGGHLSLDDACILQGPALPCRRQRHSRNGRRTGNAQNGWARQEDQVDLRDDVYRHSGHRGHPAFRRLLFKRRDSVRDFPKRSRRSHSHPLCPRFARRRAHGVLHVPSDFPDLSRQAALRRTQSACARVALEHARAAGRPRNSLRCRRLVCTAGVFPGAGLLREFPRTRVWRTGSCGGGRGSRRAPT